jgi:NTE family protein
MATSSFPVLRAWLSERPFALCLSSGFFGFFAHTGVMRALEEEGLLPARLSGSSAGALIGGLWAAGLSATRLRDELFALRREHFWDPGAGLGLLRGRLFRERLVDLLPVPTFAACRVPLAISVHDVLSWSTRVIDTGALAPAIQASCAVPFLFHPIWLDGRPHLDGGIADRPGLVGMPPGERVLYHHLTSRSPWRSSLEIPSRADLTVLAIDNLPRVNPFRLSEGVRAFTAARVATLEALDRRIVGGAVRVHLAA